MRYEMISADCHLDLCWLPTDLFVTRATAGMRDRMPHVIEEPKGLKAQNVVRLDPPRESAGSGSGAGARGERGGRGGGGGGRY